MCNIDGFVVKGSQFLEKFLLISSAVAGLIAALFTVISVYHIIMERKEKLEDKVKNAFLKSKVWTNEGDINSKDSVFFDLCIEEPNHHFFSGKINYYNAEQEQHLTFYFEKVNRKIITLKLHETVGWRNVGSAKARLTFINPESFKIVFSKGYGFRKDRFMPDLPRKTKIFPSKVNGTISEVATRQNDISRKILTNDIIVALSPERNYAKAKEMLGVPDKVIKDSSVFEDKFRFDVISKEDLENITSDLYFLENAVLKVTTIDKQSIHALTVLCNDELLLPDLPHYCSDKVCQELLENAIIGSVRTIKESAIALRTYMGPPFYKHMTYFTNGYLEDEDNPNEDKLIGSEIVGFCLSESQMVFYIYDYELR